MTDDTRSIKCPICLYAFNAKERIPKIFPTCGHTICKECLTHVLKMKEPQCPLDKLKFNRNLKTVDSFPTNILGKELLEINSIWSKCPTHNQPNKLICLTDNTLVCGDCVLFGDHKGHNVRILSEFQDAAQAKKEQLEAMKADLSQTSTQLNWSLQQEQQKNKESHSGKISRTPCND